MAKFTVASTPRLFDQKCGEYRDGEPLFMPCTAWRELAEHIAESLTKGARVLVVGRLRLSRWETPEGEKRSMMQLDADEVGPSLRFATASVKKLTRSRGGDGFMPGRRAGRRLGVGGPGVAGVVEPGCVTWWRR